MKIHNVRLGLACNSSSSHSLIIVNDPSEFVDDMNLTLHDGTESIYDDNDPEEIKFYVERHNSHIESKKKKMEENCYKFGWEEFVAASDELKRKYLAIILRDNLRKLPENFYRVIIKDWLGTSIDGSALDSYIDHQSMFALPCAFGTNVPDEGFFKEFRDFILQDKVIILGGNDNSEKPHKYYYKGDRVRLDIPKEAIGRYVCRKDPVHNYWTLFSQGEGSKIRMSFGQPDGFKPTKAFAPELIDIKINDYCPFNCKFCYQDSTADKGHSKIYWYGFAKMLAEHQVFEVALGGGEPTMHPDFLGILTNFREFGIVPNFTTKNLKWLKHHEDWQPILDKAGAFAFSADNPDQIKKLNALMTAHGIPKNKASIQIVMGTISEWEFEQIVRACQDANFRLTLLGYKNVGRGSEFKPKSYTWWLDSLKKLCEEGYSQICIDTALALDYEEQILASGIPEYLFHTQEGKFSMYFDAMNMMAGPSSYCDSKEMIPWDWSHYGPKESLEEIFSTF